MKEFLEQKEKELSEELLRLQNFLQYLDGERQKTMTRIIEVQGALKLIQEAKTKSSENK